MNDLANNIIAINKDENYSIITAKVVSADLNQYTIEMNMETYKAKKAFSCLMEPIKNDIVLCAKNDDLNFYIMSIIERIEDNNVDIKFPYNANISADSGDINIRACKDYSVLSKNINTISNKTVHKSKEAYIAYDHTIATGKEFQGNFKTIKIISNLINTMAKQVIDKFKGYIRSTEDNDMVQSGQMTRKADGLYALDSKHTIMNSKKSTKIDGDKILMG